MASTECRRWVGISAVALTAISAAAISIAAVLFSASVCKRKCRLLASRIRDLEASLKASAEKAACERRGRVRAQQELRKALTQRSSNGPTTDSFSPCYPMAPIGVIQSCFYTRNGTPRQPLLVPLSRACLVFNSTRVPAEALEGLSDYSHCWILYVFHLNTDIEKLWKQPSQSKFKAKVRVPRLKGGKMGVMATRSPHRPCPIGLTVAKVEALDGHALLLSGVDLVDGTPVLDIKPYLPYSDSIQNATVPKWVKAENALAVASVSFSEDFPSSLSSCWTIAEKQSLYGSVEEFRSLIKEVLSWDIRSLSQQIRPHQVALQKSEGLDLLDEEDGGGHESGQDLNGEASSLSLTDISYHLVLEGIDVSYRIDDLSNIVVEKATIVSGSKSFIKHRCNYSMWREKLREKNDGFA